MKKYDQSGGAALIISNIFLVIVLIAAGAFGYWAYTSRQDYKDNSDKKSAVAVAKAEVVQFNKDTADFAEREKSPNKTFKGHATYGSVTFNYPKTWSGYIDESNPTDPLKAMFYPDLVPADIPINNVNPKYALRLDLIDESYKQVLQEYQQFLDDGSLKAVAYVPPKMVRVTGTQTGTKLTGKLEEGVNGSMVVIKVRDKTMKIYTESPKFFRDFNNTVLKTLTFVP